MRDKRPKVSMLAKLLGLFATGAVAYPYSRVLQEMLYYVEDLLSALLLFSVAFSIVAVVIVILFLVDEGLHRVLACAGPYLVRRPLRLPEI